MKTRASNDVKLSILEFWSILYHAQRYFWHIKEGNPNILTSFLKKTDMQQTHAFPEYSLFTKWECLLNFKNMWIFYT